MLKTNFIYQNESGFAADHHTYTMVAREIGEIIKTSCVVAICPPRRKGTASRMVVNPRAIRIISIENRYNNRLG